MRILIWDAQKHVDLDRDSDPDPEHWCRQSWYRRVLLATVGKVPPPILHKVLAAEQGVSGDPRREHMEMADPCYSIQLFSIIFSSTTSWFLHTLTGSHSLNWYTHHLLLLPQPLFTPSWPLLALSWPLVHCHSLYWLSQWGTVQYDAKVSSSLQS